MTTRGVISNMLHLPISIGTRVVVPEHYTGNLICGEIVGISSRGIIETYIVLLDQPCKTSDGLIRAISVHGPELTLEDGSAPWRL